MQSTYPNHAMPDAVHVLNSEGGRLSYPRANEDVYTDNTEDMRPHDVLVRRRTHTPHAHAARRTREMRHGRRHVVTVNATSRFGVCSKRC